MNAEIIAIGDEIVTGQTLDTNSQWLSQRLAELGVRVLFHTTVGDELEPMADVFRVAMGRADVVVATGGLGPTADDLTRDALAAVAGRPLRLDEKALEHVGGIFARRGMQMPESNRLQAMFPQGSRVIDNPHGTAPGIEMTVDRGEIGLNNEDCAGVCRVYALPGVPSEMREMWEGSLRGLLCAAGAGKRIVMHKKINCFGAGESRIEEMLPDLIRRGRKPTVGITASGATISLRISADGESEAECLATVEPTVKIIRDCLGGLIFGEDEETLQDAVVSLLRSRGETLAAAEWGTAGLVTRWLSEADCSEACAKSGGFLGGVVGRGEGLFKSLSIQSNSVRGGTGCLSASVELQARADKQPVAPKQQPVTPDDEAVTPELVGEMARACRERFSSDYGLAIGPIAAGVAETNAEVSPLYVFAALASPRGVEVKRLLYVWNPALRETLLGKHALNFVRLAIRERNG